MRAWILLALAAALSGCATHSAHVGRGPDRLHNWTSVFNLEPGTSVRVEVGYRNFWQASLVGVTDSTLTIRSGYGMPTTIARDRIDSVAADLPIGWRLDKLGAVTVAGTVAGAVVGLATNNAKVASASGKALAVEGIGWAWTASDGHEFRVVYVRP